MVLRASDINAALFFTAGNVGVNTTNPSQLVDVNGTLKTSTLNATGNSNTLGSIVTTNGNVGIGTVSPICKLDIISSNTKGSLYLGNNLQNRKLVLYDDTGNEHQYWGLGINSSIFRYQAAGNSAHYHQFFAGSSLLMSIASSSGNVGINKDVPVEKLDVRGNILIGNSTQSNYIVFSGTYGDGGDGYGRHTYIGERVYGGTESSEMLLFKGNDFTGSDGPDRIRLLAGQHKFDIVSAAGSFETVGAASATNAMTISASGFVGIGTSSPTYPLHIGGFTEQWPIAIRIEPSTNAGSDRSQIVMGDWEMSSDISGNTSKDFYIYKAGYGTAMFIGPAGAVGLGRNYSVEPLSKLHILQEQIDSAGDLTNYKCAAITMENSNTTNKWSLAVNGGNNLVLAYNLVEKGFVNSGINVGQIDFTGQHRCQSNITDIDADISSKVGYIVKSTGVYNNLSESNDPSVNESLPEVALTTSSYEKTVFGVISDIEDSSTKRKYTQGSFVSVYEKSEDDVRLIINSLGEGGIWVCDANGNLNNGSFITTSNVPGIGMKQDADRAANYTVAKATCSVDFANVPSSFKKRYVKSDGEIITETQYNDFKTSGVDVYMSVFIGCTYHCG